MTNVHRAIIFYLFLFVFLICAPLLVLHTSGYRYSFRTGRIARVGALVLASAPRGAVITLNDRPVPTQTPTSLELAADEYRVTVAKSGFHDWTKLLPVTSQKTTFAEDIILWKDTAPASVANITPLATTMRGHIMIAYDALRGLLIYERATNTIIPITDLPVLRNEISATLSPEEDAALITYTDLAGDARFLAVHIPEGTIFNTEFMKTFAFDALTWGASAGTLYGVSGNRLHSANLFTERMDTIAQSGFPFLVRGTEVWSILQTEQVLLAKSQAGAPGRTPEPVVALPAGHYTMLPAPDPYLLLHETDRNRILLIDLLRPTEIVVELAATHAVLRVNGRGTLELLSWNAFELWRVDATTGTQELLRRQSEPVETAVWYPRGEYLVIATRSRVEMFELDSRGGRNITLLAEFPEHRVRDLMVDPDGRTLFITVTDGPQAGLYTLELQ